MKPSQTVDKGASAAGLRAVAGFEAVKGAIVLLLGSGMLFLLHRDVERAVEDLLLHLHVYPDRRLSHALLSAASRMTDARLWALAAGSAAYAAVRFTEAWGLWHRREWAVWFALLSFGLYLPWEIVKVAERFTLLHAAAFFGNLAVFAYMLEIRLRAWRRARKCER